MNNIPPGLLHALARLALPSQYHEVAGVVINEVVIPRIAQAQQQQLATQSQTAPDSAILPLSYWPEFAKFLQGQESANWIILGREGSGKTALTLRLAQELARPTYGIGLPSVPGVRHIEPEEITKVVHGSVILIDDSSLFFSSMDYRSSINQAMKDLLFIRRHRDLVVIANLQSSDSMDKYILRPTALFLKPQNILWEHAERPGVSKHINSAMEVYETIPEQQWQRYVYVVTHSFKGMLEVPLPEGWNEGISKNKRRSQPAELPGKREPEGDLLGEW